MSRDDLRILVEQSGNIVVKILAVLEPNKEERKKDKYALSTVIAQDVKTGEKIRLLRKQKKERYVLGSICVVKWDKLYGTYRICKIY